MIICTTLKMIKGRKSTLRKSHTHSVDLRPFMFVVLLRWTCVLLHLWRGICVDLRPFAITENQIFEREYLETGDQITQSTYAIACRFKVFSPSTYSTLL
eukprot:sb/3478758/